jgi:hypothetical protein
MTTEVLTGNQKLEILAKFLEELDTTKVKFEMDYWGILPLEKEDEEAWSCGFAGCAAGWGASIPELRAAGLEFHKYGRSFSLVYDGYMSENALAAFFEIDLETVDRFFMPSTYQIKIEDITPKKVAARIREYLS